MIMRVADHEIHQGRRDVQLRGDVALRYAVDAVLLEGMARALRQLLKGRRHDSQSLTARHGVLRARTLRDQLAAHLFRRAEPHFAGAPPRAVDGEVAHHAEQIGGRCLDLLLDAAFADFQHHILHHVLGEALAADDARGLGDQPVALFHENRDEVVSVSVGAPRSHGTVLR